MLIDNVYTLATSKSIAEGRLVSAIRGRAHHHRADVPHPNHRPLWQNIHILQKRIALRKRTGLTAGFAKI